MRCERCGMAIGFGTNRARVLGREYIVCEPCDRELVQIKGRFQAMAAVMIVGVVVLAVAVLSGCYTPPRAYPPWEGPGPMPEPGWTNRQANI